MSHSNGALFFQLSRRAAERAPRPARRRRHGVLLRVVTALRPRRRR